MKVVLTAKAKKQLARLPTNEQRRITKKLRGLKNPAGSGKKLKGQLENLHSLRSWPYRILYSKEKHVITILIIAHRQGVYKK